MAYIYANISSYFVWCHAGPNGLTGSAHGNDGADAKIRLVLENGESAFFFFYRDGVALPPNQRILYSSGRSAYYVTYRWPQFASIIDLLRNEKPLTFFFRDSVRDGVPANEATLSTSAEPVGEEEGSA